VAELELNKRNVNMNMNININNNQSNGMNSINKKLSVNNNNPNIVNHKPEQQKVQNSDKSNSKTNTCSNSMQNQIDLKSNIKNIKKNLKELQNKTNETTSNKPEEQISYQSSSNKNAAKENNCIEQVLVLDPEYLEDEAPDTEREAEALAAEQEQEENNIQNLSILSIHKTHKTRQDSEFTDDANRAPIDQEEYNQMIEENCENLEEILAIKKDLHFRKIKLDEEIFDDQMLRNFDRKYISMIEPLFFTPSSKTSK